MSYVNRNMIVPIDLVPVCRALVVAATQSEEIANGMWVTELGSTPEGPVTHAISAGATSVALAELMPLIVFKEEGVEVVPGNPEAVAQLSELVTPEHIEDLFSVVVVTDEDPWVTMGRMNLQIVNPS